MDGISEIVVGSSHALMAFDIGCGLTVMFVQLPEWNSRVNVIDLIENGFCL